MGARERFEQHGQQIVDAYSALQDQIFEVIINTLKDGDYRHVDKGDVVLWQAEQLQKLGQLNQETMQLMANADGLSKAAIVDLVKFNGLQVQDEVDNEIQSLTNEPAPVSNDVQLLLNGIVSQTWDDLQNNINESLVTRNYGASSVSHVYRRILTESTAATVSGLLTHQDAVEAAVYRAVDRGLPTKLVDKAGRNWSLEGYARAVVNTTVNHTYNAVRLQRMKDFGMHLALMSSHPNSRPACAWIQGHVVNLVPPESPDYNDKYDSIFNHGYGTPAGTQGVNCRHHLFPFVPGVSVNHQPQYDPEEVIKNGKLVQQQRARERAIRAAKHRLQAAKELGDVEMVNQTKTLLRARQRKLREFIKDTNAGRKVPILTRDYSREKIVKVVPKDYMAKKQEFKIFKSSNRVSRVHTKQVRGYRENFWSEGSSKKYRSTIKTIDQAMHEYRKQSIPKIVVTDSRKMGKRAAAAYDHVAGALYVNSDVMKNGQSIAEYLKSGYFASTNVNDIIKHEMTHKLNWDKAREEYHLHPNRYRDVEDAIDKLNEPIFNYAKRLTYDDPRLFDNSRYLRDTMFHHKSREVVAELNVLNISDDMLRKMLKEVLA